MEDARGDRGGWHDESSSETPEENDRDLRVLVVPSQRERGGDNGDRTAPRVPRERPRHAPHRERHDDERDEPEDATHRSDGPEDPIERVGRDEHKQGGRQRESEPREEGAERPRAQKTDRYPDLAARRARQRLAETDKVRVRLLVEPASALDVFTAEVAEMRDRSTERRQPEPQRDEEDLERG